MDTRSSRSSIEHSGEVTRDSRASIELPAEAKIDLGKWLNVRLLDVSTTGFRLNWTPEAQVGKHLLVKIGDLGPLAATVKWQSPQGAGCEFKRPLGEYIFEDLVRRANGG